MYYTFTFFYYLACTVHLGLTNNYKLTLDLCYTFVQNPLVSLSLWVLIPVHTQDLRYYFFQPTSSDMQKMVVMVKNLVLKAL